jgi:intracellular sulfur oxidation DsrE/DsrF family protein
MKSVALIGAIVSLVCVTQVHAQDAPFGSSKFSAYSDIDGVKQLRVVWDFNFVDPKSVGVALDAINALLKATADFGPHDIDPVKVVVVTHGPELVVFAKKNYPKYRHIVDRAASLAKQGVRFEACRNAAAAEGFGAEDLHGFVTMVPAGAYAIAYWQAKGYSLNAVGATMPTRPVSALNKDDLGKR